MKIAVLQFFSWLERRVALAAVYARALERIEIMDKSGFDAVWLAEHHFSSFSVCPSVHMMGTLAAARTTRLRIGTGVSLAPFYHPLRLAEEVALLDVLSGGRVNWGAGRGFARVEFENFGVPPDESTSRFRETVEIVLRAWTTEKLSFAGKHFHFEDVEVLPKPLQQPHPPVWMAATSEPALDWAAGRGFSILMDPAFRLPGASCRWRGWWRWPIPPPRPPKSRGAARNGSSIRISARRTARSGSPTRPRRAPIRCNATSTR
jgi:alkanesulfonate monooxygenase SsuD/methylene tetrahydromethanopterin reductase-like flavin-dependent oxidoreductase (luciferase family)